MKIRTSELKGAALDWAVAKAQYKLPDFEVRDKLINGKVRVRKTRRFLGIPRDWGWFSPSTDWAQGGPIIEREWITLTPTRSGYWGAEIIHAIPGPLGRFQWMGSGPTPLIAAMRCFVASKLGELGEEVDVPEELWDV